MDELGFPNAHILIVDDQQPNVDLLEGFLEIQGYENVKSTTDSRDVFRLYDSFAPDLILLDLAMPYLTGFEVIDKLRPMIDENTFLPILVLSANITSEAKQQALSEGASDFLSKPFDLTEVGLRIRNLLYARSLHLQLKNQNQHLEEKVKERTLELEKLAIDLLAAKNKAEASDRLKTSFLQTISHEIRTPMNGILGFASLLTSEDLDFDEKQEYVRLMGTSADRLVNTITDYVTISQIYSNNVEVTTQSVRLIQFLYDIEKKFQKFCIEKGLTFKLQVPDQPFEVTLKTDPELLSKVITHILTNAIKFTHEGNITLGFLIQPSEIEFFVSDTGIGIKEDEQKKVFDKFVQGDGSSTRIFEGSGLGLSICQGILKLLGGKIRIKSVFGEGSTFYFTLPIQNNSPQ